MNGLRLEQEPSQWDGLTTLIAKTKKVWRILKPQFDPLKLFKAGNGFVFSGFGKLLMLDRHDIDLFELIESHLLFFLH